MGALNVKEAMEKLEEDRKENLEGGGLQFIERQHSLGKLTVRERLDILYDPGTFEEWGSTVRGTDLPMDGKVRKTPSDAMIIGSGKINGREVGVSAADFTIMAGSIGTQHCIKMTKAMEWAVKWHIPFIWILDSAGGRLSQAGNIGRCGSMDFWFYMQSFASGKIPQVNVLLGPCVAGQGYCPNLCEFNIMAEKTSYMWLGGPRMVAAAKKEEKVKLGGEVGSARYHMQFGSADILGEDDRDALLKTRFLLSYFPQNYLERPPVVETGDAPNRMVEGLYDIVPAAGSYDMHQVIGKLVDNGEHLEIKSDYAKQIITCFARFAGQAVGIIANNPAEPGGMDNDACDKCNKFIRILDAYNFPLVNLVDTPSTIPGEEWESGGLIRHQSRLIYAYATATIPKLSVVLRHCYADNGGLVMGFSKGMGADLCYVWPTSELALECSEMDIVASCDLEKGAYEGYLKRAREKLDPFDLGLYAISQTMDEVIDPRDTRRKIIRALEITANKAEELPGRAKSMHGVMPV